MVGSIHFVAKENTDVRFQWVNVLLSLWRFVSSHPTNLLCIQIDIDLLVWKQVQKGHVHGYFAFGGSTVILLFERDRIKFDDDLLQNTSKRTETLVRVNTRLGKAIHQVHSSFVWLSSSSYWYDSCLANLLISFVFVCLVFFVSLEYEKWQSWSWSLESLESCSLVGVVGFPAWILFFCLEMRRCNLWPFELHGLTSCDSIWFALIYFWFDLIWVEVL